MASERETENLTLDCLGVALDSSNVFAQGDINNSDIDKLLREAGGKPNTQDLNDISVATNKTKGKPEFIITFNEDPSLLLVVECKKSIKNHVSVELNKPKKYAVDGVPFYAKHLKQKFNVICLLLQFSIGNALNILMEEKEKLS